MERCFLSAILDYLKPVRDAGAPEEWKGGVVGIIVDEAILNTSAYSDARLFIRENYFLKAVISLPRNAFEFLARTTAKTSILILTRKPDAAVLQREPVFFAKAHTIGYTSTGVDDVNDLPAIVDAFNIWRASVPSAYVGAVATPSRIAEAVSKVPPVDGKVSLYELDPENSRERIDFAHKRMCELVGAMAKHIVLSSIIEHVVCIPNTSLVDEEALIHCYAWVRSVDGRVYPKGEQDLKYEGKDLRELRAGDILISGIDAVRGAIGVVGSNCDGLVVSKEFFTFRVRDDAINDVDAEYLVRVLRSEKMRAVLEGSITGVSNRTRLESAEQLLSLPIAPLPTLAEQKKVSGKVRDAFRAQDKAAQIFAELDKAF